MKNRRLIAVVAGGTALAVVVLVAALREKPEREGPPTGAPAATSTLPLPSPLAEKRAAEISPTPAASPSPSVAEMAAWETQIDQVLRANVNETQTAQILLNMLPTLPEEGQIEAANHIANLLPDESYALAKPVLLNPTLPETVLSVLFSDLMNREDGVKLRAFVEVAKIPNHPFHEEATNDLQIYLGDDYGADWPKWSAAVEKFLKESEPQ